MARFTRVKRLATISATFAIALSIGYVMQYGDADAARSTSENSASDQRLTPLPDSSPLARATSMTPKIVVAAERVSDENALRVEPGSIKLTALVAENAQAVVSGRSVEPEILASANTVACDVVLSSVIEPAAMIAVSVSSPCRPSTAFEVHHNGMIFTSLTDEEGNATVTLPALAVDALVFVSFKDGAEQAIKMNVANATEYHRVVLQWNGPFADYVRLVDATGDDVEQIGTLKRFGVATDGMARFAEVYSFPAAFPASEGIADLSVHAEIAQTTCGRELTAQRLHAFPGAELAVKDIRITLPDCQHVGTYLELKKVLGGQTLLPG